VQEIFLFCITSILALSPPNLLTNGYRRFFPPGVRRLEREFHHSSPTNAEVKNGGAIPPLPVLFIVKCLIKNTDNCTVYFLEVFFSLCWDFTMTYAAFYAITYQKIIYLTEEPITCNTLRYYEERAILV
jgi:hypothetical protein